MLGKIDVISIVHFNEETEQYTVQVIEEPTWVSKTERTVHEKGVKFAQVTTIRYTADFIPKLGDYAVKGDLTGLEINSRKDLSEYTVITIQSISDNRHGFSPHIKLQGV